MSETKQEAFDKVARALRSEAADLEAKHRAEHNGILRDARKGDMDWQRGHMDGLRESADLLDDGKGA